MLSLFCRRNKRTASSGRHAGYVAIDALVTLNVSVEGDMMSSLACLGVRAEAKESERLRRDRIIGGVISPSLLIFPWDLRLIFLPPRQGLCSPLIFFFPVEAMARTTERVQGCCVVGVRVVVSY